jgi:hypothetical protein
MPFDISYDLSALHATGYATVERGDNTSELYIHYAEKETSGFHYFIYARESDTFLYATPVPPTHTCLRKLLSRYGL